MGLNLATEEGILHFCAEQRERMTRAWHEHGEWNVRGFSFSGFVIATHEPGGVEPATETTQAKYLVGPKLDEPTAIPVYLPEYFALFVPPQNCSALFGKAVKTYAEMTRSIGSVMMSETWVVTHRHTEQDAPIKTRRERRELAQDFRDSLPRSLEDAPGRREALILNLEHYEVGSQLWMAEIIREPDRLGEWVLQNMIGTEGNIVGMTPGRETVGSS